MRSPRFASHVAAGLLAAACALTQRPAVSVAAPDDETDDDASAAQDAGDDGRADPSPIGAYFAELERMGLIDVSTGDKTSLTRELGEAEQLLHSGAAVDAAIALYAIVESPRYVGFDDFVDFQNAEYDLGVALAHAGAPTSALAVLERVIRRGPTAAYWAPAHQQAVDIALESRDHAGVLARLERAAPSTGEGAGTLPASAMGERSYLRGRIAYDAGKLVDADTVLATVPARSRLASAAIYLRGVIAARDGKYRAAADAMCSVAEGADDARLAFVVDDRYYTIKDLARLGLGRLAHEQGAFDDAYYHYFQIPQDSDRLPEALFEASWSMYQKRDLTPARDLVHEFLQAFPSSPLWPEASLLAGYVELADCKFDGSQAWYDTLITRLGPVVAELDAARTDPALRSSLFTQALDRWRAQAVPAADATLADATPASTPLADAVALLRVDPAFVRLHDAMSGMDRAVGDAAIVMQQWKDLAHQLTTTDVGAVAATTTVEQDTSRDASGVAQDFASLTDQVARAQQDLARGRRDGTVDVSAAREEASRLDELGQRVAAARARADAAADTASENIAATAPAGLRPMIAKDVDAARRLRDHARDLRVRLARTADGLAQAAIERLYTQTRRVLDKAKLGKIDAVIGQKRALDIDVQDLAAGRMPAELRGRLWSAGDIADDEEYWPYQGEFWADEYEGWR